MHNQNRERETEMRKSEMFAGYHEWNSWKHTMIEIFGGKDKNFNFSLGVKFVKGIIKKANSGFKLKISKYT